MSGPQGAGIPEGLLRRVLRAVFGSGSDVSVANPLPTQDSGIHTNPQRYIVDHEFSSNPYDLTDAFPHAIYTHSAGKSVRVRTIVMQNHGAGAPARVHLELSDTTKRSIDFTIPVNETATFHFYEGIVFGDEDCYAHSDSANVEVQIMGLEI